MRLILHTLWSYILTIEASQLDDYDIKMYWFSLLMVPVFQKPKHISPRCIIVDIITIDTTGELDHEPNQQCHSD